MDLSIVILTGGTSRRMGTDKASMRLGSRSMLEHALAQIPSSTSVVVVGEDFSPRPDHVLVVREDPPLGGPVAALGAALPKITTTKVGLVAVDMPFGPQIVHSLASQLTDEFDAVVPIDTQGFHQGLAAVYSSNALRRALSAFSAGASMKSLLATLNIFTIPLSDELLIDLDTPQEVERFLEETL